MRRIWFNLENAQLYENLPSYTASRFTDQLMPMNPYILQKDFATSVKHPCAKNCNICIDMHTKCYREYIQIVLKDDCEEYGTIQIMRNNTKNKPNTLRHHSHTS